MDRRRQGIRLELSRLLQGNEPYDIDLLSLEELSRMQAILARRDQVGIEGLSEPDLRELEEILVSAMLFPPFEAELPS